MKKAIFTALFIAVFLAGCAQTQSVKPDPPQQAQHRPAKAGKTFMQTFIHFFESRD